MGKFEVKLNLQGLNELMKSPEMQAHLKEAGENVARAAGDGYEHNTIVGNYIAAENIYPGNREAAIDNSQNDTLVKALGSVGLSMKK